MATKDIRLQVRMAEEMYAKLKAEAEEQGRTVSNLIRWLIEKHYEK